MRFGERGMGSVLLKPVELEIIQSQTCIKKAPLLKTDASQCEHKFIQRRINVAATS